MEMPQLGDRFAYVGRLAPTPTGELHCGHALTFFTAFERARLVGGKLILRFEDLDTQRCKPQLITSQMEDLQWLGITWDGEPVFQSQRSQSYLKAWKILRDQCLLYPCPRSRSEISTFAPHTEEPIFPKEWRNDPRWSFSYKGPEGVNWRFRVPDGEEIVFHDLMLGEIRLKAGQNFGDFLVWNRHNVPANELAVVVDDLAMGVTEIVRGEDLLTSTARQILLCRALGGNYPATFHTPLVCDEYGRRLAKRDHATSIRTLRTQGWSPSDVLSFARARCQPTAAAPRLKITENLVAEK